jgi:hypothetical protein
MEFRSLDIRAADFSDIDYVVRRMRDMDAREIYGARWTSDPDSLIGEMSRALDGGLYVPLYALARRGIYRPIALIGVALVAPQAGQANMFATSEWPLIQKDATRFIRDVLIPRLTFCGMRRVELRALKSWRGNCAWLEALGAKFECLVEGLGKEPYVQYAWTLPHTMTKEA